MATLSFIVACLLVFGFQWRDPFLTHVGVFAPGLFSAGESWRLVTAHFLHDPLLFPIHLGLNLLCIAVIGLLVERVLGSGRTIVVMGVSALGSSYGCWLAGYDQTLGASGVAAGGVSLSGTGTACMIVSARLNGILPVASHLAPARFTES